MANREVRTLNLKAWLGKGVSERELARAVSHGLVVDEAFSAMMDESPAEDINRALKLASDGFEGKSTSWQDGEMLAPLLDRITLSGKS